jgi:excisionase family DNA binding protein
MVPTENKEDHLLTIAEVAKRLRVDATTVRRWINSGTLEAVSLPHLNKRQSYRVKQSTISALLSGEK